MESTILKTALFFLIVLVFTLSGNAQIEEGEYGTTLKNYNKVEVYEKIKDKFKLKLHYLDVRRTPDIINCKVESSNFITGYGDYNAVIVIKGGKMELYILESRYSNIIKYAGLLYKPEQKAEFKGLGKAYQSTVGTNFVLDTITSDVHAENIGKVVFYQNSTLPGQVKKEMLVTDWDFKKPIYFRFYLENTLGNLFVKELQGKSPDDVHYGYSLYLNGNKIAEVTDNESGSLLGNVKEKLDDTKETTYEDYFLVTVGKNSILDNFLLLSNLLSDPSQFKIGNNSMEIGLYIFNNAGQRKEVSRGKINLSITQADLNAVLTNYDIWRIQKPALVNKVYEKNLLALAKEQYKEESIYKLFISENFVETKNKEGDVNGRYLVVSFLGKNADGVCKLVQFFAGQNLVGGAYSQNFTYNGFKDARKIPCAIIDLKK